MVFSIKETPNTNNWTTTQIQKLTHQNYNDINELYALNFIKKNSKNISNTYVAETKEIFFFFRLKQWTYSSPQFLSPLIKQKTNTGIWIKNNSLPIFPDVKKKIQIQEIFYKSKCPGLLTNYAIQQKKNLLLMQKNSKNSLFNIAFEAYPHLILYFNIAQTNKIFTELKHIPIPHLSTQNIAQSNYFQSFPFFISSHKNFYFLNNLIKRSNIDTLDENWPTISLFSQMKKNIQKKQKKNNNVWFENITYKKLVKKLTCELVFKTKQKKFLQNKKRLLILKKIILTNSLKNRLPILKKKHTYNIKIIKTVNWAKPLWTWKTDRYIYIRYKNYLQKLFKKIKNFKIYDTPNLKPKHKILINKKNKFHVGTIIHLKKYKIKKLSKWQIKKKKFIFFFKRKHHINFIKRIKIQQYFKNNKKTFKNLSLLFFLNLLRLQQQKNPNYIFIRFKKIRNLKKYKFKYTWKFNQKWIKKQTRLFLKYPKYWKKKSTPTLLKKSQHKRKRRYLPPLNFFIKNWKLIKK